MANIYRYILTNDRTTTTTTNINESIMGNIYRYMLPNQTTTTTHINGSIIWVKYMAYITQ